MKKARITIFTQLDKRINKFSYDGSVVEEAGLYAINYHDTSSNTATSILCTNGGVRVKRSGELTSSLDYIEGMLTKADLQTPYGILTQSAHTRRIEKKVSEKRIVIVLDAKQYVDDQLVGEKMMISAEYSA